MSDRTGTVGRPSVYPDRVTYHEKPEVVAAIQAAADAKGLRFSDVQRLVNRAGLEALQAA